MNVNSGVNADTGRFTSLLAQGTYPRAIYDKVLSESHGCVVTPTLGSILPNWLLVIPRMRVINFARWQAATGIKPSDVVKAILARYDLDGDRVFWFEHGPSEEGSSIGCGVDQAHLHVIVDAPFSFQDFVSTIQYRDKQLTVVLARRVSGSAYELPFTFFGFMDLDQPRSLIFEDLGIRLDVTLKSDRIELHASRETEQLELALELTVNQNEETQRAKTYAARECGSDGRSQKLPE